MLKFKINCKLKSPSIQKFGHNSRNNPIIKIYNDSILQFECYQ